MDHILFKDERLNGWEYGMLRSFEKAIIKNTGARIASIPMYDYPGVNKLLPYFGNGMNRDKYRKYFPKQKFQASGDVAWCILMGPENYLFDLYSSWAENFKVKILYLFDTLPGQYPLIKKLFSNNKWDILITAFNDAAEDLQKLTGRKWHVIEQAADDIIFSPVPFEQKNIHFSAYGRRYQPFHEALKEFCAVNKLYYDYTTHDARHPVVGAEELYKQYAWHINHSLFTVSWPVEFTNSQRAGHLHPITCRWFEAASAGTLILGKAPDNDGFKQMLKEDLVVEINPDAPRKEVLNKLDDIWQKRESLYRKANTIQQENINRWTWNARVESILKLI